MRLHLSIALALLSLSLGCGSGGNAEPGPAGSGGNTGSDTIAFCSAGGTTPVTITDETNYSFTSTLSIRMSTLKDDTDLMFDWTSVTTDFYGQSVDPAADIDTVLISLWDLQPDELMDRLNRDDLSRSDNEGAIMVYPDGSYTNANLLSFGLLGDPVPNEDEIWKRFDTSLPGYQFPQDQHTFLLMAATGTDIGRGGRMLSLFNVDPSSSEMGLTLDNDSTSLDWQVDLARAKAVSVPAGTPGLTIDWSQMTVNALGNDYVGNQVTEAVVAHFPTGSIADLEHDFLRLQTVADAWYSGLVRIGESIDLSTLADTGGATFPGIDADGTWLVALFCTTSCNNPAPWSITILRACP
jgi:hypothetical protein